MSVSLYDFLRKEVKKMVFSLGRYEKGNNHERNGKIRHNTCSRRDKQ
jgi:hypothetical protein